MAINLLPVELAPKGPVVRISSALKSVTTAGFILLIVTIIGLISLSVLNSLQERASLTRQEEIKGNIKSLEQSEQRMVLVKDRLGKIQKAASEENSNKNIRVLASSLSALPPGIGVTEVDISPKKNEISILSPNSSSLSQFFANFISVGDFQNINLKSFGFNPTSGYLVTLEVIPK